MKILHYTLGFPPERSGGLVKYAIDLMEEQSKQGHEVSVLYPGKINLFTKRTYIKLMNSKKIKKYQIFNSLPLAIFGGIKSPEDFMKKISFKIYLDLLKSINPDVIHVHTLMGIHKEFFDAAKKLDIRLVYTSHDYYGLAPEPNFFINGKSYDQDNSVENWIRASEHAMSTNKLRLFQSRFYPYIKKLAKYITKKDLNNAFTEEDKVILYEEDAKKKYLILKNYYQTMYAMVDGFHFNSNIAEEIYTHNISKNFQKKIISITNANISDAKNLNRSDNSKIRLAYIGPDKEYKGFFEFIDLSNKLSSNQYEFHTYGYTPRKEIDNIIQHGKYCSSNIADIYKNIDILIVPSRWKETFGLIVLEALSYKTPVIVSENVGAKDLIPDSYIYSSIDELAEIINLNKINRDHFNFKVNTMTRHVTEIITFYNEVDV